MGSRRVMSPGHGAGGPESSPFASVSEADLPLERPVQSHTSDRDQTRAVVNGKDHLGAGCAQLRPPSGSRPDGLEGRPIPWWEEGDSRRTVVEISSADPVTALAGAFQSGIHRTGEAEGKNDSDVSVEHEPPPGVLQMQQFRPPHRRNVGDESIQEGAGNSGGHL